MEWVTQNAKWIIPMIMFIGAMWVYKYKVDVIEKRLETKEENVKKILSGIAFIQKSVDELNIKMEYKADKEVIAEIKGKIDAIENILTREKH